MYKCLKTITQTVQCIYYERREKEIPSVTPPKSKTLIK